MQSSPPADSCTPSIAAILLCGCSTEHELRKRRVISERNLKGKEGRVLRTVIMGTPRLCAYGAAKKKKGFTKFSPGSLLPPYCLTISSFLCTVSRKHN
jgi:hypothetical protein